jgi:hypothetical protein
MHLLALDRSPRILRLADYVAPEIGDEAPPSDRAANDVSSFDPPPRPASAAARPRRWEHLQLAA